MGLLRQSLDDYYRNPILLAPQLLGWAATSLAAFFLYLALEGVISGPEASTWPILLVLVALTIEFLALVGQAAMTRNVVRGELVSLDLLIEGITSYSLRLIGMGLVVGAFGIAAIFVLSIPVVLAVLPYLGGNAFPGIGPVGIEAESIILAALRDVSVGASFVAAAAESILTLGLAGASLEGLNVVSSLKEAVLTALRRPVEFVIMLFAFSLPGIASALPTGASSSMSELSSVFSFSVLTQLVMVVLTPFLFILGFRMYEGSTEKEGGLAQLPVLEVHERRYRQGYQTT